MAGGGRAVGIFDAEAHAVVGDGPDNLTINLDHPNVQRHRCPSYRGVTDIYTRKPNAAGHAAKLAADFCRS